MPPLGKDLLIVGAGHARRSWARDTGLQRIGRTNPSGWARAGWPGLTAARGAVAGILPFGLDQAVAGKAVPKAAAMWCRSRTGPDFAGAAARRAARATTAPRDGRRQATHPVACNAKMIQAKIAVRPSNGSGETLWLR